MMPYWALTRYPMGITIFMLPKAIGGMANGVLEVNHRARFVKL